MNSYLDLRDKYFSFWKEKPRNSVQIPSSPLVPDNDPTTLFTGSGMQPLIPYLLGQPHPLGKRLVDIQKCFRGQDIDEVGDNRHDSFFEMMGNWSLGDYFKEEQLAWYYEFLTNVLGLDPEKLHITCFEGNAFVPKDIEAVEVWKKLGIPDKRIYFYSGKSNWWSRSGPPEKMPIGEIGGPSSEVFYDFGEKWHMHENSKFSKDECHPNCDCGRYGEIGNSVFITYQKTVDGFSELPQKNVDFGGGVERTLAAMNDDPDIFKTGVFLPIVKELEKRLSVDYDSSDELVAKSLRIITDHLKAATFLLADGVRPSNKQQGYILRRLLRRAATKAFGIKKGFDSQDFKALAQAVIGIYPDYFKKTDVEELVSQVSIEILKFRKTLEEGIKKIDEISPFDLYQTYGFPVEVTEELYKERGKVIDMDEFRKHLAEHQNSSRTSSTGMFKGGLADQSDKVIKYHSATHLLQAALRKILGDHVHQEGSNLTGERLRFDFSHGEKLTPEEIRQIEAFINEQIGKGLVRSVETESYDKAIASGALAFFKERYPEKVTVYTFTDPKTGEVVSREICGGPHVETTNDMGKFKIIKEESVAAGIRRIYGTLE